jgi:hypothetical protein
MKRFLKAAGATILLVLFVVVFGIAANFFIDWLFTVKLASILLVFVIGVIGYVFYSFYDLFKH